MKFLTHLYRNVLASFAIDLFLIKTHNHKKVERHAFVWEENFSEEEQEKQQKKIHYKKYIPPHYLKIKKVYRSKLHYVSTKSKNVRDLDQRKIRRKFKNC